MARFKIDNYDIASRPFALYRAEPRWHHALTGSVRWVLIATDANREPLIEFHESIKDLPIYLD